MVEVLLLQLCYTRSYSAIIQSLSEIIGQSVDILTYILLILHLILFIGANLCERDIFE
jgi:hypothetical protein